MKSYRINYIDSGDKRYKSFETPATDVNIAINILRERESHRSRVVEIIELPGLVTQHMRIGSPSPLPYTRFS